MKFESCHLLSLEILLPFYVHYYNSAPVWAIFSMKKVKKSWPLFSNAGPKRDEVKYGDWNWSGRNSHFFVAEDMVQTGVQSTFELTIYKLYIYNQHLPKAYT